MSVIKILVAAIMVSFGGAVNAQPVAVGTELQIGDVPIHDPVMMKQDSIYYLFATGNGISLWSSKDRKMWKKEKPVFDAPPAWAVALPVLKGTSGRLIFVITTAFTISIIRCRRLGKILRVLVWRSIKL
jgi:hypothetical protein